MHAAFFLPTHAPIVGNIGALVAQKGQHHLIPLDLVDNVDDKVHVNKNADEVKKSWQTV